MSTADRPIRTSSGVLGARPLPGQTFHERDPHTLAASAICRISATRYQARTRLYPGGVLQLEGFPVAEIGDLFARVGLNQLNQCLANRLAVRHGFTFRG